MADGTARAVCAVNVGDRVLGDDGKARDVAATTSGRGTMYCVSPVRSRELTYGALFDDSFTCNADHILVIVLESLKNIRRLTGKQGGVAGAIVDGAEREIDENADAAAADDDDDSTKRVTYEARYWKLQEDPALGFARPYEVGTRFSYDPAPLARMGLTRDSAVAQGKAHAAACKRQLAEIFGTSVGMVAMHIDVPNNNVRVRSGEKWPRAGEYSQEQLDRLAKMDPPLSRVFYFDRDIVPGNGAHKLFRTPKDAYAAAVRCQEEKGVYEWHVKVRDYLAYRNAAKPKVKIDCCMRFGAAIEQWPVPRVGRTFTSLVRDAVASAGLNVQASAIENDVAWLIGLWLGDGTRNMPTVALACYEQEVVDRVEEVGKRLGLGLALTPSGDSLCWHGRREGVGRKCYRIVPHNVLVNVLTALGSYAKKDISRDARELLLGTSADVRRHLLAGLIDSDGSKEGDGQQRRLCFSQSLRAINHDKILRLAYDLSRSLGIQTLSSKQQVSDHCTGALFMEGRLDMSGPIDQLPITVPHKQSEVVAALHDRPLLQFEITRVADGRFCGFTVADGESPLFCLASFVVSHNCPKGECSARSVVFILIANTQKSAVSA
jgi:hypothetical protein